MAIGSKSPVALSVVSGLLVVMIILAQLIVMPVAADYNANVASDGIVVHISADFDQGITIQPSTNTSTYAAFGHIPIFNNSTVPQSFGDMLNEAIQAKTPAASVSQITFSVNSNGTFLHYDLGFNLAGVISSQGDTDKVDMSWRSFIITDDVKVASVSVNFVLPTYLTNQITSLLDLPPSQSQPIQITRLWYWDGKVVQRATVGQLVHTASLFNFTSLNMPLQNWQTSADPAHQTFSFQATTGFNLTYSERFIEVGESGTAYSNALYNLKANIQAPWSSVASGDTLIIEGKGAWTEWLMLGLIIAAIGIFGVSLFLERRFGRSTPRKLKK